MIDAQQVEQIIYRALAALDAEQASPEPIPLAPDTVLFGDGARLDSLGLVSLISDVETTLNLDHELDICLADDRALSRSESPYTTVAALRDYVLELTAAA